MKSIQFMTVFIFAFTMLAPTASAQIVSVDECQKLKDKIDRYNQLRRQGGSGSQMDSWKRSRRELERNFREKGCRQHAWALK